MPTSIFDAKNLLQQAIERSPLQVTPETFATEAINTMHQAGVSYTLITKQKELLGIFTERDIVKLTVSEMSLESVTISKVMTSNLITISLTETCDIFSVLALFRSSNIRHLPVLDQQGNLFGIITADSVRAILKPTDLLKMRYVEDIMTTKVITAPTNASVFQIAKQMATHRKSCIVICEADDDLLPITNNKLLKPVGIITERDIVKFKISGLELMQTPAAIVMSTPLIPVKINFTLWDIHQIMQQRRIRRLVVVDEKGYLAGIVTQSNILQSLDPVELYTTVELLQQTVVEKTQELRKINEQMQQEMAQRQQVEEQLRQTNEHLEEQVKARTFELSQSNVQLAASNQELQEALSNLQIAQTELIQSEKMAALGHMVAEISHELNTPLAALKASIYNIIAFLNEDSENLLFFCQQLSPELCSDFLNLLQKSIAKKSRLSSKEERQLRKAVQQQLEEKAIANSKIIANQIVELGIFEDIEPFFCLLQAPDSTNILEVAYQISCLYKNANTIKTATERATKVVVALKKYTHFDNSDQKIISNIIEGIEIILTLYEGQFKQGVEVMKNYETNLPLVLCYPDELNQVWTNLIHNALQAMNNQGTLEIEVKQQEANVIVKITDSGSGILPENLSKIFKPFFTTKPAAEGSGLGLDIVKKIIDKHQGTITVESVPGKTTFTTFLPINLK
jgi:two-component system NtrC family sensor kinase